MGYSDCKGKEPRGRGGGGGNTKKKGSIYNKSTIRQKCNSSPWGTALFCGKGIHYSEKFTTPFMYYKNLSKDQFYLNKCFFAYKDLTLADKFSCTIVNVLKYFFQKTHLWYILFSKYTPVHLIYVTKQKILTVVVKLGNRCQNYLLFIWTWFKGKRIRFAANKSI